MSKDAFAESVIRNKKNRGSSSTSYNLYSKGGSILYQQQKHNFELDMQRQGKQQKMA